MAAPNRNPKSTCEACEIRSVDFTNPENETVDVSEAATQMARQAVASSRDKRSSVIESGDQDLQENASCDALGATRNCVARILAGNCLKYSTILDGQIVGRKKRGRFGR